MSAKNFFLVLLMILCCRQAQALAAECPSYVTPEITITPIFGNLNYDRTLGAKELHALSIGQIEFTSKQTPAGLTTFKHNMQSEYVFRELQFQDGSVCSQVVKYNLNLSVEDLTVYTAKELPQNSCAYNAIIEHEMKHVAVLQEFVDGALTPTKRQIGELLDYIGVRYASSSQEASDNIKSAVNDYITALYKNFAVALKKMESDVDTDEERERLDTVCNGELSRVISRAFQ